MNHKPRGFSLIEVMIVVAIIAIISAVALPSYTEYVRRGHRSDARAALLQAAQWMERAATARGVYPATNQVPEAVLRMQSGRYNVAIVVADGRTFTLTATPAGAQVGDKCGNLTLTNTGERGVTNSVSPMNAQTCWSR